MWPKWNGIIGNVAVGKTRISWGNHKNISWLLLGTFMGRKQITTYFQNISRMYTFILLCKQGHYREVPRWGASNGAQLPTKLKIFLPSFIYFFYFILWNFLVQTLQCFFFCFKKRLFLYLNHNLPRPFFSVLPTGPKPAQISFPVHKNLPPRDFSIMTFFASNKHATCPKVKHRIKKKRATLN